MRDRRLVDLVLADDAHRRCLDELAKGRRLAERCRVELERLLAEVRRG